ncbi:LOW QUALITY PROTEIN: insulin-like 3 [Dasypus novemcinctus]|uniref:LOW QUALITY PROTEIN: insulin-like 3 n=1 Tax=Dasypus novemcinctus TaxID=9361 RepID=UPI00265D8EF7|nr:LOW QUALITY PROTEIN: insulin-like 3 [Dasypus novemcinctus]
MAPRAPAWALLLLGPALLRALDPAAAPDAPERLCGLRLVRALVRECGGPRWSPEAPRPAAGGDRELLQWLQGRHLHGLAADGDPGPQPPALRRRRRAAAANPAQSCCLSGCTRQDLLSLCPH